MQEDSAPKGDWVTLGAPEPITSNATRGLEVQMLVVDNTDYAVARILSPFSGPTGMLNEDDRAQWQAWGFRWCAVPIDQIGGVLRELSPIQPARAQWLGEFSQWRPIVRARTVRRQSVRVGSEQTLVQGGKPRLIARSWIQPMISEHGFVPGVRMDLGLQLELPTGARDIWAVEVEGLPMIDDAGPVLPGLLTSVHADGNYALVLVADSPDRDWPGLPTPVGQGADERGDDPVGPSEETGDEEPADAQEGAKAEPTPGDDRRALGPEPIVLKTLGELVFTTRGSGPARSGARYDPPRSVVVILIPRVEGGYGLFPALTDEKEAE